jgi:hypothetical protein
MTDDCGGVCLLDSGCEESGRGEAALLPAGPVVTGRVESGKTWLTRCWQPPESAIKLKVVVETIMAKLTELAG